MKIDILDPLTIQIKDKHFLHSNPIAGNWPEAQGWYSSPSEDKWQAMMKWAFENDMVCNRGRGTTVKFAHEKDVLAFVLRWA